MSVIDELKRLSSKIDYKETSFERRQAIVDEISNDEFIIDYLDNYDANITSSKNLSESDPVFSFLDRLTNYLLNCEEVKIDKKDTEYKIYTDENTFRRAMSKEAKLDAMTKGESEDLSKDNVIHFLKNSNLAHKKSKTQKILKKDYSNPELKDVLEQYNNFLKIVTNELKDHKNSKLSRIQLSKISGSIKNDMIDSKEIILGVFGYNSNPSESTNIDWDRFDYKNKNHVKAMLYMKPGYKNDEDLMHLVNDFDEKLKKCYLTKEQRAIISMIRDNIKISEIAHELNIDRTLLYRKIDSIAGKFVKRYSRAAD